MIFELSILTIIIVSIVRLLNTMRMSNNDGTEYERPNIAFVTAGKFNFQTEFSSLLQSEN